MIDKAMQYLIDRLNTEINAIQENLADDNCKDFPEYKKACGEVKGLLTARMMCLDLQQRWEDYDD
jgi:hypothetical protein